MQPLGVSLSVFFLNEYLVVLVAEDVRMGVHDNIFLSKKLGLAPFDHLKLVP